MCSQLVTVNMFMKRICQSLRTILIDPGGLKSNMLTLSSGE